MTVLYEVRGEVAVLQLDLPPVNSLGSAMREALANAIVRAQAAGEVRCIVITGTGKVFSGGADIREFETPAALVEPNLHQLIAIVEGSSKPIIAACNGVTMGGGLELSLACHYRVATTNATMALPEVKLGLLPGAGGTQRLPRAVGAEKALSMIVSGEPITAHDALAYGLVQRVVSPNSFEDVLAFAAEIAIKNRHPRLRDAQVRLPAGTDVTAFFDAARQRVAQQARGLVAPLACLDCVEAAVLQPFNDGLAFERGKFIALMTGTESKALRHAFFAERAAGKIADVPADTATRPVTQVGVIGFGTMGGGIAMSFANASIPVLIVERSREALDRGMDACKKQWEASARKGRLTAEQVAQRLALLRPTLDDNDLADADLVIEAVFEDLATKRTVFERLDRIMKPGAILASNTSTLDLDAIASFTRRPQDVIGTHFFSPAHVMRLLEVVRGRTTGKDVLATVMQLARRLNKVAVVAGVCDGFIGNRMIQEYGRQALFLVDEGASAQQIDGALTRFGMAMGPLAMSDLAGLDIGYAIRQRRYAENPEQTYSRIGDRLVEAGRLGQKSGEGWYRYEAGQRTPLVDPAVEAMVDAHRRSLGIAPRVIDDAEIVDRCVLALVNEGARLLQDGIAQRASDIDVVYLAGYGFPPARGGPMFYAQTLSFSEVIKRMRQFAANPHADADFWQPAPRLLRAVKSGGWE